MNQPVLLGNRYLLEERLGTGGMALVYRAKDQMLERSVAIKILRDTYTDDPDFQERFRQEARAAANLSHPNLVTVHDFGLDAGRLFIVMEYVPGAHLKAILERRGRLPLDETLDLMIQACAGVGYAHRAGLVHCDIKPHNLLISPDHRLKVTDFGIARALASIHPDEKTDVVWGSPQYFSPEQAAGSAPSPASDVYSLGVILFEALTGQLPFQSESATELARLHRDTMPPSPRSLNADIPPALEQIMLKVLAKEPAARYRTADQLGRVLVSFSRPGSLQPKPGETPAPAGTTSFQPGGPPVTAGSPSAAPVFNPPGATVGAASHAYRPAYNAPIDPKTEAPAVHNGQFSAPEQKPWDVDWLTIGLGLLTLIAVGGLVPLYIWVYFLLFQ